MQGEKKTTVITMIRGCAFDSYGSTLCIGSDSQGLRVVDFPAGVAGGGPGAADAAGSMYASVGYGSPAVLKPIMVTGGGVTSHTAAGGSYSATGQQQKPSSSTILSVKIISRVGNSPLVAFVGSVQTPATSSSSVSSIAAHSSSLSSPSLQNAISASAASRTPSNNHQQQQQQHRIVDSDRCVHVYDVSSDTLLANIFFETAVIAIQMNRVRLVVILEKATYVFQLPTLEQLSFLPTDEPVNRFGLGTLSQVDPVYENCFFAFPLQAAYHRSSGSSSHNNSEQSTTTTGRKFTGESQRFSHISSNSNNSSSSSTTHVGEVMILDAIDLAVISKIQAHRQPIAAVEFSANGTRLATCSTEGTNIKVWSNPSCTLMYQLRRGNVSASVRVLAFNLTADMLVVGGENGTIHLFFCGAGQQQQPHQNDAVSGARQQQRGNEGGQPTSGIRSFAKIYIPVAPHAGGGGGIHRNGLDDGEPLSSGKGSGGGGGASSSSSLSSQLPRGKCRMLCAFSEDSRVLRVVLERWDHNSSPTTMTSPQQQQQQAGGGGSILTILAQYKVDRDARKLYEAVLGTSR